MRATDDPFSKLSRRPRKWPRTQGTAIVRPASSGRVISEAEWCRRVATAKNRRHQATLSDNCTKSVAFVPDREYRLTATPQDMHSAGEVPRLTRTKIDRGITGYGAVFYRNGEPGTQFVLAKGLAERIMPRAFDRAVLEDDVRALFNHDASLVLGRKSAGTLRLVVDQIGLRYSAKLPDSDVGQRVAEAVRRGDVTGSSFAFRAVEAAHVVEGNLAIRELHAVELLDVGPVTYPAYGATSAKLTAAGRSGRTQWQRQIDQINMSADLALAGLPTK